MEQVPFQTLIQASNSWVFPLTLSSKNPRKLVSSLEQENWFLKSSLKSYFLIPTP